MWTVSRLSGSCADPRVCSLRCGELSGPPSGYQRRCGTICCRCRRCVARDVDLRPRPRALRTAASQSCLSFLCILCVPFEHSANNTLRRPRRVPNIPDSIPHYPPPPAHLHRRIPRTRLNGTDSNYRRPRGLRRRHVLGPPRHRHRQHAGGRGWHDELFGGAYASLLPVLAVIP